MPIQINKINFGAELEGCIIRETTVYDYTLTAAAVHYYHHDG